MNTRDLRPADGVVTRVHAKGLVAVNLDTGHCWELNETGSLVWEALTSGAPLSETGRTVCERYGISSEVFEKDAAQLIAALLDAGLLVRG